jgi:hypothetical protein
MSKFQKRHYVEIARLLRNEFAYDSGVQLRAVDAFVRLFRADNALFNTERFKEAVLTGKGLGYDC